ncbi:hypothetical protein CLV84_3378 [Neolewinella xylanilytica]|uniref:PorV/PorQ family protein n=1 Tax=Neolewinella xylanilytica TaxID=1514080 RepID=A0A2S6I5S5_9BACT|nr:hypothetical protein [Neolewinella xylanilytica]PPK86451.1 hypothetical protein CLV84_3378 [Neolewinella xylanilytica]
MFRLVLWATLLLPAYLTAQNPLLSVTDAGTVGLAGAGVGTGGLSALWLNPAGLASGRGLSFGASVIQPYGLSELRLVTGGVLYRGFGLQLAAQGFGDYRANRFGVVYGRSVSANWRIGGALVALRQSVRGYPAQTRFLPAIGVQFSATERLVCGLQLTKPAAAGDLPFLGTVGLKYQLSERVNLLVDEVYDGFRGLSTRLGLCYAPVRQVELRLGFRTAPGQITFGATYLLGGEMMVAAAGAQHPLLGTTAGLGIRRESTE